MFTLDNRTILVCLVIVGTLTSVFSLIPTKRYKMNRLKGFRLANISYILGFGTLLFQGILPRFFSVIIANSLILLSFFLFTNLVLGLFGVINDVRFDIGVFVINLIIFLVFLYIFPNTYIRIVAISASISIILTKSILKLLDFLVKNKQPLLIVLISTLGFYVSILVIRVIITTQLNFKIESIFKIDIATGLSFISTIAYHLSVNFVIFIRLLNINEETLEGKVQLIKETHNDMKEINGLIINSEKHTLNTLFYEKVSNFIQNRFNIASIVIYNLDKEAKMLNMVSYSNIIHEILDKVVKLPVTNETITGRAVLTMEPQFVEVSNYPDSELKEVLKRENYNELMSYPIKSKNGIIGAFTLGIKISPNFIKEDNDFFSLICDQIGTIIENISLYEKLDDLATKDALTKISNRRNFDLLFDHSFLKSKRYNSDLAIMMLDIDYFKSVNDTHGHDAGDRVLIQVVNIVKGQLRESDFFARYGGEEFIILFEGCTLDSVKETGERIRKSIMDNRFDIGPFEIDITISIGLAGIVPNETDKNDIVKRADKALYKAKKNGRNKVVLYDKSWD